MRSKRAKRGSVTVSNVDGNLRLMFTYQGKRQTIALGLKDKPYHRAQASQRAALLQREIDYGRFELSKLAEVRAWLHGAERPANEPPPPPLPPLSALWRQYVEVKRPGKSPSTIREYEAVARVIDRLPTGDMTQAQTMLDALGLLTPARQRKMLTQISACANWAMKSGRIDNNPFIGTSRAVKVHRQAKGEGETKAFSKAERDIIIEAFRQSRYYAHYAPLVAFLFFTGVRPCEVSPIQWRQVRIDHILLDQARVYTGHGFTTKAGLKTQPSRRFPMNSQLQAIISGLERGADDDLVFPSPTGKPIDMNNFSRRIWRSVLESLPGVEYRNLYQVRHSFISHCRESDIPSPQIAEWAGNSAKMVDQVYTHVTQRCAVPEL